MQKSLILILVTTARISNANTELVKEYIEENIPSHSKSPFRLELHLCVHINLPKRRKPLRKYLCKYHFMVSIDTNPFIFFFSFYLRFPIAAFYFPNQSPRDIESFFK